jgi:hypothetical protein
MTKQSCPLTTSSTLGTSLGEPFHEVLTILVSGKVDVRRTSDVLPLFHSFFLDACFKEPQSDEIYVRVLVLE